MAEFGRCRTTFWRLNDLEFRLAGVSRRPTGLFAIQPSGVAKRGGNNTFVSATWPSGRESEWAKALVPDVEFRVDTSTTSVWPARGGARKRPQFGRAQHRAGFKDDLAWRMRLTPHGLLGSWSLDRAWWERGRSPVVAGRSGGWPWPKMDLASSAPEL